MEFELLNRLVNLIEDMRVAKGTDRSEKARHYAITLTELEKAYAYFVTFVVEPAQKAQA